MSFVSFLQEKKTSPFLFFLEEKTVGLRGKRSPSDGRTQAHPALSSVGIPQRVCLPPPPCLCPCPPRLRAGFPVQADHAKENHLRLSFFSALQPLSPTCSTKRTSSFLFRRKEAKENHLRNSYFSPLLSLPPTCNTKRTVQMRTVRFSVPSRTCGKTAFPQKDIRPRCVFCFFSSRKEIVPLSFSF